MNFIRRLSLTLDDEKKNRRNTLTVEEDPKLRRKSLTTDEERGIQQLKGRFGDDLKPEYFNDDTIFLRFLRARDRRVSRAEEMLRNHFQWREKNSVDDIQEWTPVEVSKYFPLSLICLSKTGSPVRYLNFGTMDAKGILKSSSKVDSVSVVVQQLEADVIRMQRISKATGTNVDQWIYIFDFENYTFFKATHKPTLQMLITLMVTYEAHYPERLKLAFIINASAYFTLLFSVVKPLFTGNTLSKIKIHGKDGWKEELLKYIDSEQLPVFLGGTRTDPDGNPMCPSVVNPGGIVPESYFFRSTTRRLCSQPDVKKLHVPRMSKVQVTLNVEEPGSNIEWEFETESKDIGFGLLYQPHDSLNEKPEEILPKQRVEAHIQAETGVYKCEMPGTYILAFDNSYSWLQNKEIFVRAAVKKPSGEKIQIWE